MLTNNSGIDVPIDTIVSPIIISGIWKFFAIPLAPSTNKSAPTINKTNPITINILDKIIVKIPFLLIIFLVLLFMILNNFIIIIFILYFCQLLFKTI